MKKLKCMALIVGVISLALVEAPVFAGEPVDSVGIVEAQAFLEEYQAASTAQSASFYDLYSDRAVIHARIQGKEQGMAFQGRAFKEWGRELIERHRAAPDASEFHEATVEERGVRLIVRAKRYSVKHCYWDLNYRVAIQKEGVSYRIVDEHLTTNPSGFCSDNRIAPAPRATPITLSPNGQGALTRGQRPLWRPLSQEELAQAALRLAAESTTRSVNSAHSAAAVVQSPGSPGVVSVSAAPSALWVTPAD
jgi:hypothetical protein